MRASGDGDLQAEAAAWVARLEGQSPTADAREQFNDWLARSPAHASAYEAASRTWRDLATMRSSDHYRALLGTPTLRERFVSALSATRWPALVVGSAALCALAWLALSFDVSTFLHGPTQVMTQVAEVREVTLPDGSRVVLGGQSQLSFDIGARARHATVVGGDAYFAVSPDPDRPFIVSIDEVRVSVVGTQFEIRRRKGEVSVAVAEGTVEVSRAGTSVRLHRGEALTAAADLRIVRAVETADIAAWRSGRLVYDNAELRDVVDDANRYARNRIVIEDEQLASLRITTSFPASQVDAMVETLQAALPLVAERQAGGDIVLRARD